MVTTKAGWHFLPVNRRLGYRDGRRVRKGKRLEMMYRKGRRQPEICVRGMHAAEQISEAARYRKGSVLCRVLVSGATVDDYTKARTFQTNYEGKFVGRYRTVVWWREFTLRDLRAMEEKLQLFGHTSSVKKAIGYLSHKHPDKVDAYLERWAERHGAPRSRR